MLNVMKSFLPIIAFFLINAITVKLSNYSFGICLPITFTVSTLVLYLSQFILETFIFGFYLIVGLSVLGLVFVFKDIKDTNYRKLYFSIGFYSCLIILGFVFFVDYNRCFSAWDEFSHWGKMVKEMIRLDSFYSVEESQLLVHKEYPPFVSIFEMLWCMLCGGYSESFTTMAIHYFELSLFIPVILDMKQESNSILNKLIRVFACFAITISIVLFFDSSHKFNYIYTDIFMMMYYVYSILLINEYQDNRRTTIYVFILIALVGLSLTKQMAIAFILLAWFYFTYKELLYENKNKQSIVFSLLVFIIPVLSILFWKRYTSSLNLVGQFDLPDNCISQFINIIFGKGSIIQKQTFAGYITAIINEQISIGALTISYLGAALFALFLLCVLFMLIKDNKNKKQCISYFVLFLLGTFCYAVLMLFMYMFCFSESEMLGLASFHRYMTCYITSEYLIMFPLISKMLNIQQNKYLFGCLIILFLLIVTTNFEVIYSSCWNQFAIYGENYGEYKKVANSISGITEDGSRICIISDDQEYLYLNYYFNNRIVISDDNCNIQFDSINYLFIADDTNNDYLYDYVDNVEYGDLFRVIKNNGNVELVKIESIKTIR